MLRITQAAREPSHVVLRVEGRLVSRWASLLAAETLKLLEQNLAVVLDLSNVSYIDGPGVETLRQLQNGNLRIGNCHPLIREMLDEAEPP